MSTKRYFWLKLKDDFFNQKEIKMLRRIAGGDTYALIYLKLLLLSLKNDGKIYFDGIADNFVDEIALDIDEDVENVQVTINFLSQKGLIEFSDDEHEFYLSNIASMIGSETDAARRKRKQRLREKNQKVIESPKRDNVTQVSQVGHIEKEKEIELEKEPELEKESAAPNPHKVYQENFGVENPLIIESINHWVDDLGSELVIEAMKRAALDQKGYRYAQGIMKQWVKENLKTLEDIKADDAAFENTMKKKAGSYQKLVRKERLPRWFGKEVIDDDPVDPEVEREFREKLKALREGN